MAPAPRRSAMVGYGRAYRSLFICFASPRCVLGWTCLESGYCTQCVSYNARVPGATKNIWTESNPNLQNPNTPLELVDRQVCDFDFIRLTPKLPPMKHCNGLNMHHCKLRYSAALLPPTALLNNDTSLILKQQNTVRVGGEKHTVATTKHKQGNSIPHSTQSCEKPHK